MTEKIIDNIKFSIVNSIKPCIEYDENDQPFAFIEDTYRDAASEEIINFVVKTLVNFAVKLDDNEYKEGLNELLKSKNIDLVSSGPEQIKMKIEESLKYFFEH